MKKIYRKLTADQVARGVVFSSCLSPDRVEHDTIHEVVASDPDEERQRVIRNLIQEEVEQQ